MSMRTVSPNSDITRVDTSNAYFLGALAEVYNATYGQWFTYIYVKNGGANPWAIGNIVGRRAGQTSYDCDLVATSEAGTAIAGVAQAVVAAGSYAWVLREGLGSVYSTAGYAADVGIMMSAANAGHAIIVGVYTDEAFGRSLAVNGGGAAALAYVNCRG